MLKRSTLRRAAVLSVAATAVVTIGSAASAGQKVDTMNVDCNGTEVHSGVSIVQGSKGTFKIKQNSATDDRRTDFNARSSNGNDLGFKMTGTGDTVTWSGVLPSTYTVRARKYVPSDCSPSNPFDDGGYNVTYTVTSTS